MNATYEAGTVAMVTAYNRPTHFRAFFDGKTWREHGAAYFCVDSPTDVRPLVVLDPETLPDFRGYLPESRLDYDSDDHRLVSVIREIEAQTRPPKPPEPTGLGAVVEDAEGRIWTRLGGDPAWGSYDPPMDVHDIGHYADIAAVRVLSEGIQ